MVDSSVGDRIVILGRGGVDEDSAAALLADVTGRRVIKIDKHFWPVDHRVHPAPHWALVQDAIASNPQWIMDADLGPFDIAEPKLGYPDEVWVLDYSPITCLLRALRYPQERRDLRVWLFRWRREYLNHALADIAKVAPEVTVRRFTSPGQLAEALASVPRPDVVAEPAS
ncbi:MAG: hypothetical protein K4304_10050 [Propionicimonas sp.]